MAKLIYSGGTSLDGYVKDESGNFEWGELSEDVFDYINKRESRIGTYLLGRRMYETMIVWDTPDVIPNPTPAMLAYASIWQAAEKIVYSTTLQTVSMARARLEREFVADDVRELKAKATRHVGIGGAELAAHAIRAGLVDEYNVLIAPVIAGGGTPYLPNGNRAQLELIEERTFDNGMVHVRYGAKGGR